MTNFLTIIGILAVAAMGYVVANSAVIMAVARMAR